MLTIRDDYEKIYTNIMNTARTYLMDHPYLKSLIVGVSGGIDSGLVTALASEIVKGRPEINLIGRVIPIETNTPEEIDRAEKIGNAFCTSFEVKDLTDAFRHLSKEIISGSDRDRHTDHGEKIRQGNIKARTRMVYLFDLAHYHQGMVLSTDNYTELLLGFWTLHGDVGNYGFIQFLWKTEVYGLARFLTDKYRAAGQPEKAAALRLCIDAVPTDGLGITSSDFDQIGVTTYEEADQMLIDYLKGNKAHEAHPLIKRHLASAFKRNDPLNIPREVLFKE
ncbi:MAG: NAD(+) synthase [Proteobacteria bacterium]|nr:NAD(+) synthase [Pseudomonadota bacterium]